MSFSPRKQKSQELPEPGPVLVHYRKTENDVRPSMITTVQHVEKKLEDEKMQVEEMVDAETEADVHSQPPEEEDPGVPVTVENTEVVEYFPFGGWYWGKMDDDTILGDIAHRRNIKGAFVVWQSLKDEGEYNLHICNVGEGTRDKCSTYIIEYSNDHFYLDEKFKKFRYLEDLIENYKVYSADLGYLLTEPCKMTNDEDVKDLRRILKRAWSKPESRQAGDYVSGLLSVQHCSVKDVESMERFEVA